MSGIRAALWTIVMLLVVGCTSSPGRQNSAEVSPEKALEAYTQLGLQYLRAGDLVSAKDALQRAVTISDKHAGSYNALALVFQVEQEYVLAEQNFRKAVDLEPETASYHNNFGAFLYAQGRYSEACTELERATEDPFYTQRAQAFENLGRCFRVIQRPEAAQHAFERTLRLSPNRPLALLELTAVQFEAGRLPEARQYFDKFSTLIESRQVEHSAQSLWLGIQLSREGGSSTRGATFALLLKNLFPQSAEYANYKESLQ
uniref:type IV pilus biogenesis/stability protein PilW n=1 Tax=Marinobacterium profundum TaxID=1714300 RepID=UPI001C1FEB59|nr:type IV pilus biogenesis/stability protein PilW [Marinobacterium profundum]